MSSDVRRPLTRERIVETACRLVAESGHEQLTLRGLASELGVTAPALYDHVSSKDELLGVIAGVGYRELAASYTVEFDRAIDRVRARALAYIAFASTNSELFRVMFMFRPAAVRIEADNELVEASDVFEFGQADIARAQADGDLVDTSAEHLGLTLWAAMHGVATVSLIAEPVAAAVAEDVIDAMLAGLRPGAQQLRS